MNDFYLGLITGIAIVNFDTLSWVFKSVTKCCVRQALRNIEALDLHIRKVEFPVYEPIEEPIEEDIQVPKPAWQVEEENTKVKDEHPPDESDGDSENAGSAES